MEENGRLVQFLFSGQEVVVQTKEDGEVIRYLRGYDLVSSDSEQARAYYHYVSDEMGSITHVVAGDSKEGLNEYRYDAFGNTVYEREMVENRFRYAGQQYDGVTGQYYLRARYYNPVIGRFTQEDTYYGDGLNLYAYCRGNPVGYYDPSGYVCQKKFRAYKKIRKKHPDWTAQQAYNALKKRKSGRKLKLAGVEISLDWLPERYKAMEITGNVKVAGQDVDVSRRVYQIEIDKDYKPKNADAKGKTNK